MVTLLKAGSILNEYIAKSTDTLPVNGVPNGSKCFLMDMNEYVYFNAEAMQWTDTTTASPFVPSTDIPGNKS